MKVINLDAKIIVPIVDESRDGMTYEAQMSLAEFFENFGIDVSELTFDAVPEMWLKAMALNGPDKMRVSAQHVLNAWRPRDEQEAGS